MPIDSHAILELAKQLQADPMASEAALRAIVSRAYYAALHRVKHTFEPRDSSDQRRRESSHEEIIGRAVAYGSGANPGRMQANAIAKMLPKFKRMRVVADYKLDEIVTTAESNEAVVRCEQLFHWCAEVQQKKTT